MVKPDRVLLNRQQFQSELDRILNQTTELKGDERIVVKFPARLDHGQCWDLVRALRRAGVDARADCTWDGVKSLFIKDPDGCVTVQIKQFQDQVLKAEVGKRYERSDYTEMEVPYKTRRGKKKRSSSKGTEQLSPERLEQLLREANAPGVPFSEMGPPAPLERKFLKH